LTTERFGGILQLSGIISPRLLLCLLGAQVGSAKTVGGLGKDSSMIFKTALIALVIAGLLGCVGTAYAGTSQSWAEQPLEETEWDHTLLINQFDPALGHLVQIDVQLEAQTTGYADYQNKSLSKKANVSVTFGSDVLVTAPWATVDKHVSNTSGGILEAYDPANPTPSCATCSYDSNVSDPGNPAPLVITGAVLDSARSTYTGTGKVSVPVSATSNASMTIVGGNVAVSEFWQKSYARVTVTYHFDTV
jgi:hypothetical protein